MTHTFDVDIAKEYGVDIAIVVSNIAFWLQKNKANGKHIHDGKVWTYNSTKAFKELFPYWTENQIRRILDNMQKHGIIETGNYNSNAYDRTKWYTFTDAFMKTHASICEFCQMDSGKQPNGFGENHEPIPDNKQINETDSNTYKDNTCGEVSSETIPASPVFISLPKIGSPSQPNAIHNVTEEDIKKYEYVYPGIDVRSELKKMNLWLDSNPANKKKNVKAFIARWLAKAQDRSRGDFNGKPVEKKHAGSKEGYSVDVSKYDTI